MTTPTPLARGLSAVTLIVLCAAFAAGCGSSKGLTSTHGSGSMSAMRTTSKSSMSGMSGMSGSNPSHTPAHLLKIDGITPIPTQTLATDDWQHMKIQAMAMTAVPFVVYNGTREQTEKIPKHVSFHLMVTLNDDRSHEPIPYAGVWATITRNGKVVYDERQWPMISEYLGPHYGNNVALPGGGRYKLSLLISPPVAARHLEYKSVWLKPHRVTSSFTWTPPKS
jgi:uncharacterized protein involved in high-affinity Fe2+ transport